LPLATEYWLAFVDQAKQAGYSIWLFFICLEGPELNMIRVQRRVRRGGHDVPLEESQTVARIHQYRVNYNDHGRRGLALRQLSGKPDSQAGGSVRGWQGPLRVRADFYLGSALFAIA
jgi:hypothetical protein